MCIRDSLNIDGMLPFENMVADYVKETGNHVMYRVTPIFEGDNLLANGVLMEGYSVEDKGAGVSYCVFAYNVQPGIEIDYATGESKLDVYKRQDVDDAALALIALRFLEGFLQKRCGVTVQDRLSIDLLGQKND